eukprot:2715094-Karenia_brevis.AAC.1
MGPGPGPWEVLGPQTAFDLKTTEEPLSIHRSLKVNEGVTDLVFEHEAGDENEVEDYDSGDNDD